MSVLKFLSFLHSTLTMRLDIDILTECAALSVSKLYFVRFA